MRQPYSSSMGTDVVKPVSTPRQSSVVDVVHPPPMGVDVARPMPVGVVHLPTMGAGLVGPTSAQVSRQSGAGPQPVVGVDDTSGTHTHTHARTRARTRTRTRTHTHTHTHTHFNYFLNYLFTYLHETDTRHRNSTVSKHAEIKTIISTAFKRVRMVPRNPRPEVFWNCCDNIIKIDSGSWYYSSYPGIIVKNLTV